MSRCAGDQLAGFEPGQLVSENRTMLFVLFHCHASVGLVYAVPVMAPVPNLLVLSVVVSCGCAYAQWDYILSLAARST